MTRVVQARRNPPRIWKDVQSLSSKNSQEYGEEQGLSAGYRDSARIPDLYRCSIAGLAQDPRSIDLGS
jgi:hypothetical protein